MKNLFTLISISILFISSTRAAGGPDAYGYTWMTSLDVGGPTYQWYDISTTGTLVPGLLDDNSSPGMVNIGFPFHYYWNDYTQMKIGSNGWVSFDNVSNIASCFPNIPTPAGAGDNILAALMSDLNFTGAGNPGQVFTWSNNIDTFIIMFKNVPYWSINPPGWSGLNNFQIILSGADSSITFMYQSLTPVPLAAGCVDMVIGIENSTGNIGLQVYNDAMPPLTNFAIRFDYPPVVLLSVPDLTSNWNENVNNKGVFIPTGSFDMVSNLKNVGNTNISTSTTYNANIRTTALVSVANSSFILPSIAAGDDTTILFPNMANILVPGEYYFETILSNSQDINAGNNTLNTQINMVDLCNVNMLLGYTHGATPGATINWNGGANDDGVAIHVVPPVYPVTITQMDVYVSNNVSDGLLTKIYADDGPGGTHGTLLYSGSIPSGSIISGNWNTHAITPVTINSGGFYVAFYQTGTTIFIGDETVGPFSNNNYEILDDGWADYRYNDTRDLMIRCVVTNFPQAAAGVFTHSQLGSTVTFDNNTVGGENFIWDYGDGNIDTSYNAAHTYLAAGNYNACLIVQSACGADTSCVTISTCGPLSVGYNYNAVNEVVNFNDASSGNVQSYSWDFGDGSPLSTSPNPVHTYASCGDYTVCLTVTDSCNTMLTSCDTVSIDLPPVAGFNSTINGTLLNCTDASSGHGPLSYAWDFGDGGTSTVQNPTHTYAVDGTYLVCLIVTDSCGSDTICANTTTTTGIENVVVSDLHLYPNPTNGHFMINGELSGNAWVSIMVTDLLGKVIEERTPVTMSGTISIPMSLGEYPSGIYLLTINIGGVTKTYKLIKK